MDEKGGKTRERTERFICIDEMKFVFRKFSALSFYKILPAEGSCVAVLGHLSESGHLDLARWWVEGI